MSIRTSIARRATLLALCLASGAGTAYTFHRSFKNGYPAELGVTKEEANDTFTIKRGSVTYSNGRGQVFTQTSLRELTGRVERAISGDTIVVANRAGRYQVRLFRIAAPGIGQNGGKDAAAHLSSLVGGKLVSVEWSARDSRGRILGIVYLEEEDINLQMVRDGFARHDKRVDRSPDYSAAEQKARAEKCGLWAPSRPQNPDKPAAGGGPVKLRKLGTLDEFIVEANPIVFKGKPYLFEYIRWFSNEKRYPGNTLGTSCFRFLDMTDMKTLTPPFGKGLHMGNAFVDGGRVVVTCVEDWGKSRFYQLESTDLVNWSEPREILSGKGWAGYNTSVCKAGDRYVMVFELGKPLEMVGKAFTMFFAESKDLREWRQISGAVYGREFYTGAPMLRYFDGWFYFFYLEARKDGYSQRVARSRDLKEWTLSPHTVISFDADDKKMHPHSGLSAAQRENVAKAVDRNASDLDMCEHGGRLVCCYSWGNQLGTEFLALAEADATEREFCESFFR